MTTPVSSGSSGDSKPYGSDRRPYGCDFDDSDSFSGQQAYSAKPYGHPHRAASKDTHAAQACTRAIAVGARWGRAREGGVDRGDGIATDGGQRVAKAPIRDEELLRTLDDLEEQHGSMAEAIRAALRRLSDDDDATADGDVPEKAAEAHDWLVEYCGIGGRIDIEASRSLIAQKFQINKTAVDNLVIRPLDNENWIDVQQGMQTVSLVVKPRPSIEADAQEVPADD